MSSFDQVIKNILSDIFGSKEEEEVLRPKLRPSGLGAPTTSPRPRLRPEPDDDDVETPSASNSTSAFIQTMAEYDDTTEAGVDIPLSRLQANARNLNGEFKTTAMQLAKLNKGTDGSTVKVSSVEEDTTLDDLLADVQSAISKPPEQRIMGQGFKMSVSDIQTHLKARGYDTGEIDGKMGPRTRSAIKAFQKDQGLVVDGIAGKNTQAALQTEIPLGEITVTELGDAPVATSEGRNTPRERIQRILESQNYVSTPLDEFKPDLDISGIRDIKLDPTEIQTKLTGLGYDVGEIDGKIGKRTRKAIRQFQKDKGLVADGIVGPDTTEAMIRAERSIAVDEETGMPKIVEAGVLPPVSSWESFFNVFTDPETQARTLMNAAPLASKVLPVNVSTFAEFLGSEGQVDLTSDSLSGTDYFYLRNKALEVIERGDDKFTYNDWGLEDGKSALMADLTKTAWSSLTDPAFRMATLIGQTAPGNVRIEDGRIIVEDVYDFNSGPRGRKLQKAFELKEQGDIEGYEKLSAEALEGMTHLGQLRVWAAALGVPQGEGTRFKLDLGEAP